MLDRLIVRGAREHNLKDVSLDLPRDALIVFTGLSGSGKSSLAFDTIFAEGQRRYVESLSAYARQFLGQLDKPDVDFIEGLSPAVSIDQKSTSRNPRSTVGTITEVYDYLRLLYARIGHPHCPVCGEPISKQTPQQIVDRILEMDEGTRFQVLAPVIRERKGEYVDLFADLQTKGFSRVRVDGTVHPLTDPPKLKKQEKHTIEVVVDRLVARASAKQRITDSIETALVLAGGLVILEFVDLDENNENRERRFSERLACPNDHPLSVDDLEPRAFSFNSPFGACPECTGLGTRKEVDAELIVPDPERTLAEGALAAWSSGQSSEYFLRLLQGVADAQGFSVDTPWEKLTARAQEGRAPWHRRPGAHQVQEPIRPGPLLLHGVRGRHSRGLNDVMPRPTAIQRENAMKASCATSPALPAAAPGSSRRSSRSRSAVNPLPPYVRCRSVKRRRSCEPSNSTNARRSSPSAFSRRSTPGSDFSSTSDWTICLSIGQPAPSQAVRHSGSALPPRSGPVSSACFTSWMNRPSACTSATIAG